VNGSRNEAVNREGLHVSASALRANKVAELWHVNEDHVVPELQFLECLNGLMVTSMAEAMDGQRLFAARSCVTGGLCGLATRHCPENSRQLAAPISDKFRPTRP
jgi:hypothetical protein